MKRLILYLFLFIFHSEVYGQFKGQGGVYFLGNVDAPISASLYDNPNISGIVCRFKWSSVEISPDVFDWSFIDGELLKARNANKKISLQPVPQSAPSWVHDSLGAQTYFYIDKNQYHPTYGEVFSNILPYDEIYLARVRNFIYRLALKYANDTTVSYVNAVASQISRALPDSVVTDISTKKTAPFWKIFNYNADNLAEIINSMTDYYMENFPHTPLWCSVDYVTFEPKASNRQYNYLATKYTDYGVKKYPDRFGLFREDISCCTPLIPNAGSQWVIMKNNPCRTGGQMLWNVQDGQVRMNKCGIEPDTKQAVLDSAVNRAVDYGMRYVEIYAVDILDASLTSNIASANQKLKALVNYSDTNGINGLDSSLEGFELDQNYPNPFHNSTKIKFFIGQGQNVTIKLYDLLGRKIATLLDEYKEAGNYSIDFSANVFQLQNGIYFYKLSNTSQSAIKSMILMK